LPRGGQGDPGAIGAIDGGSECLLAIEAIDAFTTGAKNCRSTDRVAGRRYYRAAGWKTNPVIQAFFTVDSFAGRTEIAQPQFETRCQVSSGYGKQWTAAAGAGD